MTQVVALPYVTPEGQQVRCSTCGTWLGSQRAAIVTESGPRFFCQAIPAALPDKSCLAQWKRLRMEPSPLNGCTVLSMQPRKAIAS